MKICVTSDGTDLDANVDGRFGRCRNFIFVDTKTGEFEAVQNSNAEFAEGAGIQAAQAVNSRGAQAVLTGNVGPNAFKTLSAAGIIIYTGVGGKVKDAITAFKSSKLTPSQTSSVGSKFGIGT